MKEGLATTSLMAIVVTIISLIDSCYQARRPIISEISVSRPVQKEVSAADDPAGSEVSRTLLFSGYQWMVKSSQGRVGPGPNYFSGSADNVWIDDQGRLHLRITHSGNSWECAEVISLRSFGYGIYRFYLDTPLDNLDPNSILGLFTWSDAPEYSHREIDIECAKWGDEEDSTNAQFVVQPYQRSDHLLRFHVPSFAHTTHRFTWKQDSVFFQSLQGHHPEPPNPSNVIRQWNCTKGIPKAYDENARMNLWLMGGLKPKYLKEIEVVVKEFEFVPLQ